jgi:hypothetical protein
MKNGNINQSKAYKESALRLDYRINDIRYLTNKLKWNTELIEVWDDI